MQIYANWHIDIYDAFAWFVEEQCVLRKRAQEIISPATSFITRDIPRNIFEIVCLSNRRYFVGVCLAVLGIGVLSEI